MLAYADGAAVRAGAYPCYASGGSTYLWENETAGQIDIVRSFATTSLPNGVQDVGGVLRRLRGAVRVLAWPDRWAVTLEPHTRLRDRVEAPHPERNERIMDATSRQAQAYS